MKVLNVGAFFYQQLATITVYKLFPKVLLQLVTPGSDTMKLHCMFSQNKRF